MPRRVDGTIRERTLVDGSLRWDVRVPVSPHVTSKSSRPYHCRTFDDRNEAEAQKATWLAEYYREQGVDPSRRTVAELMRRWLEDDAAPRVRASTLEDYRATVEHHVIPRLGSVVAQRLSIADVTRFRSQCVKECGGRTAELAMRRLKQALAWGVRVEMLARDVSAPVPMPTHTKEGVRAMTHAEAQDFLTAAKSDALWPLWLVYLSTGLRRGEALGLRWQDIDTSRATLSVRQHVVPVKEGDGATRPAIQEPKSRAARRTIDLDGETVLALTRLHVTQQVAQQKAGHWEAHNLIFCTRHGGLLNPNNLYRNFARIRQDCGLDDGWHIHHLRHTHATHLLLAGVPLEAVSKRLGHANSSITLSTYSHLLPGYEGGMLAAIEQALYGGVPELDA